MRETVIRIGGATRTIRTALGGKVRTPAQLEAAHTKAVKTAAIEMRVAAAPDSMARDMAEAAAKRVTTLPKCHWAEIRRVSRPRYTDPRTYMVEVAPDHWVEKGCAYSRE